MKKRMTLLSLTGMAMLMLVGCGGSGAVESSAEPSTPASTQESTEKPASEAKPDSESKPSSASESVTTPDSSVAPAVTVESVSITDSEGAAVTDLDVVEGSRVTLKAVVNGSKTGLKVTWTSSDEAVAKVTNGVVSFKSVTENKDVTITATSKDDTTKSASLTFHVHASAIDFSNSRGNDLDNSMFLEDGSVSVSAGDTAMLYKDVYGTKWYVQADIVVDATSETDAYPKCGIMSGTEKGLWNGSSESQTIKNNFFYVDTISAQTSWTAFNMVAQNDVYTDWAWGAQLGAVSLPSDQAIARGDRFTMGLLRDGVDYYYYVTNHKEAAASADEAAPVCIKHVVDTHIAADEATYAWVGGWNDALTMSNFKALTGDAVDSMFATPASLTLDSESTTLYLGDTFQITPKVDVINYAGKITYTSDNTNVATVDANGLVTAGQTAGTANITVALGELTKTFVVTVTDDLNYKVVLDGKMDDTLWTESVKANKLTLTLNGEGEYIDFYANKNSKGIYVFADYYVNSLKGPSGNWWENDNFECKFHLVDGNVLGMSPDNGDGQLWACSQPASNFNDFFFANLDDTESGKKHMVYELFISYATLNRSGATFAEDSNVSFFVGSNPASGWKCVDGYTFNKDGFVAPTPAE